MSDIMSGVLINLSTSVVEIIAISLIAKQYISKRERRLWGPFRTMYYRSLYMFYQSMMNAAEEWIEGQLKILRKIKARGHLEQDDVTQLLALNELVSDSLDKAESLFHNNIQTVAPALTPETGRYAREPIYFHEVLKLYQTQACTAVRRFRPELIRETAYVDTFLKDIWVKGSSMRMLLDMRFSQYGDWLAEDVRQNESLYFYRGDMQSPRQGDFLTREAYEEAVQADRQLREYASQSRTIPRELPVLGFFDEGLQI